MDSRLSDHGNDGIRLQQITHVLDRGYLKYSLLVLTL